MKILLIWALILVALAKAKQRYSYIVHHKGSWGFFPDSCRFECYEHKYAVDLWMEPKSKCPQFINEAQRKYALFHYDLEQVCSHEVIIIIFTSKMSLIIFNLLFKKTIFALFSIFFHFRPIFNFCQFINFSPIFNFVSRDRLKFSILF